MTQLSHSREMMLLTGNSHRDLAEKISLRLGVRLGDCSVIQGDDRETVVDITASVRGKDVFIIQTGSKDVNDAIMELLILTYACKTASAQSIVGVLPYLPYSKQCKMRKRGSIAAKLIAKMLHKAGMTHVITMDLHQKEIQGFFDFPVDNLRASPFLIQYIQDEIPDYRNSVIVARNPGQAKRATAFAERLKLGIAVIHGEEKTPESETLDGRNSPPPPGTEQPNTIFLNLDVLPPDEQFDVNGAPMQKEKPPISIVGDVGGKIAIMIEDMIDDVSGFVAAAHALKERGAYKVYVMATHGLLSSDAPRVLEDSPIDEVVVSNTVPHEVQKIHCSKIKTVDISAMLSEAIRRIYNQESMSYLFRNISTND